MAKQHVKPGPQTVHWGYFDAGLKPVSTIESGDEITVDTVSGGPEHLPKSGHMILPELLEIHAAVPRTPFGAHIMTGPIEVKGARPGDTLQLDILSVEPRQDWGYSLIRPLAGALPNDFHETYIRHIAIDLQRKVGLLPWGGEIELAPFFGNIGVAPPPAWGRISSNIPRRHAGNIDNKELVAGSTLYIPVLAEGALLSIGDGHGVQGDGEVCVTAIETALRGVFRVTVRRDIELEMPQAETARHVITMAFDPDLDVAARDALRAMIKLIVERRGIAREDAYILCSLAADLRITQLVNQHNGVHVMLDKQYVQRQ